MYDLDNMFNGKNVRQHQQDLLRWVQHRHFAHEFVAEQRRQKTEMRSSRIVHHSLSSLLNFATALLNRSAHQDSVDETLRVNQQNFAQVSDN